MCLGGRGILRPLHLVDLGRRVGIPRVRGAFLQPLHVESLLPPPQMSQVPICFFFLLRWLKLHGQKRRKR